MDNMTGQFAVHEALRTDLPSGTTPTFGSGAMSIRDPQCRPKIVKNFQT